MKIEDQFQQVLQKAIDNGWDICGFLNDANCEKWAQGINQWQNVVDLEIYLHGHKRVIQQDTIWFDPDFAKAFFGEDKILEEYPLSDGSGEYLKIWMPAYDALRRRLAIMPRDQRLDYLYEFLKGGEK